MNTIQYFSRPKLRKTSTVLIIFPLSLSINLGFSLQLKYVTVYGKKRIMYHWCYKHLFINKNVPKHQQIGSLLSTTTYADNVALPRFPRRCYTNRSIFPARRAHSSKPAATGLLLWAHAGIDRRIDGQTDGHRSVL